MYVGSYFSVLKSVTRNIISIIIKIDFYKTFL